LHWAARELRGRSRRALGIGTGTVQRIANELG
jgi:hypothetical protein